MHFRILLSGIMLIACAASNIWALAGTQGTPLGGMGTGYIKFDARIGEFATSCLPPPAGSDGTDEFLDKVSAGSGIHLFAGGEVKKKASTSKEDAKCPLYTADFGELNSVSFKLNAFGPYISGDYNFNYQLATSPLAFFEIIATNTTGAPIDAAVAIEFTNRAAQKATLLGGAADAIIDPASNNKAISFADAPFAPAGNSGNAYLAVDSDNSTTVYSAGAYGSFATTGTLSNTNGNIVAGKCTIPANSSVRFKFVFAWWRTFRSDSDRYGTGQNDQEDYYYHNFYNNSKDVATFGLTHFDNVRGGVFSIVYRTLASNFPDWYKDRLLNNTYPLINNSQCTKDGRCAFWEGLYPIIGTIDQGEHAAVWYIHNWPQNQWNELRYWLSTMWQGDFLGQIHHDFNKAPATWTPEAHFIAPWDSWNRDDYWFQPDTKDWSDLNTMAIFKAYELMLATGNKDSMTVYFPKLKIVAERIRNMCILSKSNLPLKNRSTYDSDGRESPQYASSIIMPTYLAMEEIAKFVGDAAAAAQYREYYTLARAEFKTEIFMKHDFCQGRTFAEGDVAGYSWARYFSMEPIMDDDVVTEGCRRLWEMYGTQSSLDKKLGQWHFYTYDHWGGTEIATGNPDRAMVIHKWDRDWYYEGNPEYTFWQDLWSYTNGQKSSYMTAPLVWRSYWQFLGYMLDNANHRLWIRPQIPTEMNKVITNAALINPQGWGTLQYDERGDVAKKQVQAITVTYDIPVTLNELVLKDNTNSATPFVVVYNGAELVVATTTPETKGSEKNLRVTFAAPVQVGTAGLSIGVYSEQVSISTSRMSAIAASLSITSSDIRPNQTIRFSVDKPGNVSMELYTLSGAKIGTIMQQTSEHAGTQSFFWNGKTLSGKKISSSLSVLKLTSSSGSVSKLISAKSR